jgi:hypothetical protein
MSFGSIVTVPNLVQIGKVEPYISVETFKDDPLSNSLDLNQLVEGGTQSAQDSAIQRMIYRASAKIDNHTCGPTGTLNATVVPLQGQSFINREGCVTVNPGQPRLIGVVAAQWAYQMGAWSDIPIDQYHAFVEETTIRLKIGGGAGTINFAGIGDLSALFQGRNQQGKVYVNYTVMAGWPNSFTNLANGMAGDDSLSVTDPTGFMTGMEVTIWDGIATETNYVESVSGNVITFTSDLLYNHGFGVNVTTLPASVQQACMHFMIGMVKSRGQGGLTIASDGSAEATGSRVDAISNDEAMAYDLLDQFQATWGRS